MQTKSEKRKKRFIPIALCCLLLLISALIADSVFRTTVSQFDLVSPKLPKSFDGFRIVQLSDFHGGIFANNEILAEKVFVLEPDIIVLTGDFIDYPSALPNVIDIARKLQETGIPVYFVSGNHDWASGSIVDLFVELEDAGVICLRNEFIELNRSGEKIIVCGVEDPNSWSDLKTPDNVVSDLRSKYEDNYVLLLGHRNYWVEQYPNLPVDLILCGHSHGGIIRLPFIGGLIDTTRSFPAKYEAGLYNSGQYQMIVSRGLGNGARIPRFLNNPEIVLVTLNK